MKLDRSNIEAWLLDRLEGRLTPDQEHELTAFLLAHPDLAEELDELPTLADDPVTFGGKDALKRTLPPTGKVSAENLDEFLVARSEGDLDANGKRTLDAYLADHPEAAKAARLMAATRVAREAVGFDPRSSIVRTFPPQGLPDRHRIDDFLAAKLHGELTADQEHAVDAMIAADASVRRSWTIMQRTRIQAPAVEFTGKTALKKKEVKVIPLWSRPIVRMAAAASVALLFGVWWFDRGAVVVDERTSVDPVRKAITTDPAPRTSGIGGQPPGVHETPAVVQEQVAEERASTPKPRQITPGSDQEARAPRIRMDRLDPVLAAAERDDVRSTPRDGGPVPTVPISSDANAPPSLQGQGAMSFGELLASAVRSEVLDLPAGQTEALDRSDAVALVDKGLNALGGGRSGLDVQRTAQRRRFNLRLGDGLALAASTSR